MVPRLPGTADEGAKGGIARAGVIPPKADLGTPDYQSRHRFLKRVGDNSV